MVYRRFYISLKSFQGSLARNNIEFSFTRSFFQSKFYIVEFYLFKKKKSIKRFHPKMFFYKNKIGNKVSLLP